MEPNAQPSSSSQEPVELRKYPNRRYYDSTHSRHVTLEEIYSMIRDGREIRVTDSKSGQDITARVLAQIIIELDPPKLGVFPVALLHRILRANEQIVNDFVQKYFNQALNSFLDSQKNFEQHLRQAMGIPASAPSMLDLARMMWGPLAAPAVSKPNDKTGADEELARLKKENFDLQRRLSAKTKAGARKPRRRQK